MNKLRRYKTGFERIGMVMFVIAGVAIGLLHVIAETGFKPEPAREETIASNCKAMTRDPMRYLCREAAKAKLQLRHYISETNSRTYLIIALLMFSAAVFFTGRWTISWVREGFREGQNSDAAFRPE
jgi:hypothetical protein